MKSVNWSNGTSPSPMTEIGLPSRLTLPIMSWTA